MARPKITLDHIPAEHHEGVGLVANSWTYLEAGVERIIWRLARVNDKRGIALTTHMSMPARLDAMCALADLEFPEAPETKRLYKLKECIKGEKMAGARNEIVHSRVLHFPDPFGMTMRSIYKARGKVKKEAKSAIPQEYYDTSKRILDTASELREIIAAIYDLVEAKDGAPPP